MCKYYKHVKINVNVYVYVCLSADFSIPGIILHYDTSDLCDYYFIDPHWLYDVFCLLCTPSVLNKNNISCE